MARPIKATKASKAATATPTIIALSLVTLGKELDVKNNKVTPTSPPTNILPTYPLLPSLLYNIDYARASPLLNNDKDDENNEDKDRDNKKGAYISWSLEIKEQLIKVLYQVFKNRRAADNSFKKAMLKKAATRVRRVYKGPYEII
jgi:hypothetical protein